MKVDKFGYVGIIISFLFFSLFVFTDITLFVSQFSYYFSHLFLIFIRDEHLFDCVSVFIFFCGFLLSGICVVSSSWYATSSTTQRIIMLILNVAFVYLIILNLARMPETENLLDTLIIEGSIYQFDFFELFIAYLPRILFITSVYIFFVYIPILFEIFSLRPASNSYIVKMFYNMRPSVNIVIIMLFGLSFQPYYFRDNFYVYLDILAFLVGLGLFIWMMIKRRELFSFYEYANFAFLILGFAICVICTSTLAISDNYFKVRYTFVMFAFVAWCAEWMYNSVVKPTMERDRA